MLAKSIMHGAGLVVGLGMIYAGYAYVPPKKEIKLKISENLLCFKSIVDQNTLNSLSADPIWEELVCRAGEFRIFCPEEFKNLLIAISDVVEFEVQHLNNRKSTLGTPRKFRKYLHEVVECVREMRATIQEKCPDVINDFDEIAADIQRTHDDSAVNMLYDCTY